MSCMVVALINHFPGRLTTHPIYQLLDPRPSHYGRHFGAHCEYTEDVWMAQVILMGNCVGRRARGLDKI